jgi:hypothetical protein
MAAEQSLFGYFYGEAAPSRPALRSEQLRLLAVGLGLGLLVIEVRLIVGVLGAGGAVEQGFDGEQLDAFARQGLVRWMPNEFFARPACSAICFVGALFSSIKPIPRPAALR